MKKLLSLPLLVALALTASPCDCATYYVSPTGNDSAPGTQSQPWATLQKAEESTVSGDLVLVRPGTYAGFRVRSSGRADAYRIFRAEVPGTAIIDRRGPINVHFGNIEVEPEEGPSVDYVWIDGFTVVTPLRNGIDVRFGNYIKITNNFAGKGGWTGIFVAASNHTEITGNTAEDNGEHGIYVSNSGDHHVITGNRIRRSRMSAIQINADATYPGDGIITNALVQSNLIEDCGVAGGAAINFDGVEDSQALDNIVKNCLATGIALFAEDGTRGSRNVKVLRNIIQVSGGRWALAIPLSPPGKENPSGIEVFDNELNQPYYGAGSIWAWGRGALTMSDRNKVVDRFSLDGNTIIPLAKWRALGLDPNSTLLGEPAPPPPPPPPASLPAAPTDLTATVLSSRVALSWRDNSGNEQSFSVRRCTGSRCSPAQLATLPVGATAYSDTSVAASTAYRYQVAAVNAAGEASSTLLSVSTPSVSNPVPPPPPPPPPPNPPTGGSGFNFILQPSNLTALVTAYGNTTPPWSSAPLRMGAKTCIIVSWHPPSGPGSKIYCPVNSTDLSVWYDATLESGYAAAALPGGDNRPTTLYDILGGPAKDMIWHSYGSRIYGSFEDLEASGPPYYALRAAANFGGMQWIDWTGNKVDPRTGVSMPAYCQHLTRAGSPWGEQRCRLKSAPNTYIPVTYNLVAPPNAPVDTVVRMVAAKVSCTSMFTRVFDRDLNNDGVQDQSYWSTAEYEAFTNQNCFASAAAICNTAGVCTDQTVALGLPLIGSPIAQYDWNGDGPLDLLYANGPNPGIYLWNQVLGKYVLVEEPPDGFFRQATFYLSLYPKVAILPGGHVWSSAWQGPAGLWRSNGDGHFTEVVPCSGVWRSDGSWWPMADLNNDGQPDFVVGGCNASSTTKLEIYLRQP